MGKNAIPVVLILGLVLLGAFAYRGGSCGVGEQLAPVGAAPGPSFAGRTLDGRSVRFPEDFRGKVVVVDFWATWCGPCRAAIPGLVKAHTALAGKPVEFISISLDEPSSKSDDGLREFVSAQKMNWTHIREGGSDIAAKYGVYAIPALYLLDGDSGRILASGSELEDRVVQRVEAALAARPSR